ncbi:hypothetical protein AB0I81_29775 [Nonomuraea sp. NPDC050404]|uniref:hypothetical protein n=1 Tax=Nonomuraea sp. NPDC050404 TaxID=3155783 RepID=UPI00340ABDD7
MFATESDAEADRRGRRYVRDHQQRFPDWLLFYSPHERGLLAFYLGSCPSPGIFVAAPHPDVLLRRMAEAIQPLRRPLLAPRRPTPSGPPDGS